MREEYEKIISFLKEYQETSNINGYVIGISGGKDSTIVARLLVDAIGKDKVLGVLMPNGKQSDIDDSIRVCQLLNIKYQTIDINAIFNQFITDIEYPNSVNYVDEYPDKFITISDKSKTNIPPRIRMTVLYTIAQSLGYVVAGTGNRSERFIGWFTKWGDGACDINPIAHLTCSEVIDLGDYLQLPWDLVHKRPADGLTGKSDEDNFGFTYDILDSYIKTRRRSLFPQDTQTISKIENLHTATRHKFSPIIIKSDEYK